MTESNATLLVRLYIDEKHGDGASTEVTFLGTEKNIMYFRAQYTDTDGESLTKFYAVENNYVRLISNIPTQIRIK